MRREAISTCGSTEERQGGALGGLYEDLSEAFHVDLDLLTTGSLDEDFLQKIREEVVLLYDQQGM